MEGQHMLSLYNATSSAAVLDQPLNPALRTLITDRLSDARALELVDLTHIVVIQPGDTERAVRRELGWSPLENPIDGDRFGTVNFLPFWPWLQDLGGWYELLHPIGNDGFAYILLIENADGVLPGLLTMCRKYAREAP
jgi:hypothetical protein